MLKRNDDNIFYRNLEFRNDSLNEEKRYVDLSFSSDIPVREYLYDLGEYGNQILLHEKSNVDLSRLKTLGAGLLNHNADKIIGPLENISVSDGKGRARLFFDDDDDGNKAMGKVKSGSLRGVSVGFTIQKVRVVQTDEEFEGYKGPAVLASKWTPHEISLTPIPKDASVGIGRSFDVIAEIERTNNNTEEIEMDEKEVKKMIGDAVDGIETKLTESIVDSVRSAIAEDAKPKMKVDTVVMQDLLGRAAAISEDCKSKVTDMIVSECKAENEVLRFIADESVKNPDTNDDGSNTDPLHDDKNKKRKVEEIDNKDFFDGMSNLSLVNMN